MLIVDTSMTGAMSIKMINENSQNSKGNHLDSLDSREHEKIPQEL